ncbi:MAG TPA: VRR-NUC domain-containing protein [Gemmatimonadaceae bacterium]|nr:VRR-NUC domain-containing protein [Gemmatimonadaceae bacterium]
MSETAILLAIHDAVALTGKALLWRNNTGLARFGGARVRFGLGIGGADLVGVLIGPGKFIAIEVKTPSGRMTTEQRCWRDAVVKAGGVYILARSVEEAVEGVRNAANV